jgi:hypothetical protein
MLWKSIRGTPRKPKILAGLSALLLLTFIFFSLFGCGDILCRLNLSRCVDIEILDKESTRLLHLDAKLDEIDERAGTRVTVATASRRSCTVPNCRLRLRYGHAAPPSDKRFLVSVRAVDSHGNQLSSSDDDFVLTYGFSASAEVRLQRALDSSIIATTRYVDGIRRAMKGDASVGVERKVVGGYLAPGTFFEAYFDRAALVAVTENSRIGNDVIFTSYFAKDGKLVAAYRGKSSDPMSATLRVYFDESGKIADLINSESGTSTAADDASTRELVPRFDLLAREASRLNTGNSATASSGKYGMYVYGSGLNVLEDCDTKSRWWVVGPPALISNMREEYLARRTGQLAPVIVKYEGSLVPESRILPDGASISGDIQLSSFSFNEKAPGNCSLDRK